jgi:hypothetical protein
MPTTSWLKWGLLLAGSTLAVVQFGLWATDYLLKYILLNAVS